MKKTLVLNGVLALAFVADAEAFLRFEEHFSFYPDGPLVVHTGWSNHSGSLNELLVENNQAVIRHGTASEDAHGAFIPITMVTYAGFTMSVDDLGAPYSGTDNEYFFHLMEDGTTNFVARVDIVPPSGAGDFSLGISTAGLEADAIWPTDLEFGTSYKVIVRYDTVANQARLWVDPTVEGDTSILGNDEADPGTTISAVALRQDVSSENETIRVDDVVVGETFDEVFPLVPVELQGFWID